MSSVTRRIKKLESRSPNNMDPWLDPKIPNLSYYYFEEDGEEGEAKAKSAAIAEWEHDHGPLGGIEPNFIVRVVITGVSRHGKD